MKYHQLSILGGIIGATIIVCSIIRYYYLFYDPSQLVFSTGVGATIIGFSYIYNWMRNVEEDNNKIDKRLDSFTEWWARQDIK